MIKAVFFDLDDTLISEYDYIKSGFEYVSSQLEVSYNLSKITIYNELLDLYHKNPKMVFNRWYELKEIDYYDDDIKYLIELFRNHIPSLSLFSDVVSTINSLKSKGIIVGVITDGYKESQRKKIKVLKLANLFDKIYITDELGPEYWKPNVNIFNLISKELNVNFDEIIYIGDNPKKDFHFYKSLAIKCYRIVRPNSVYKNEPYLEDVKEMALLETLEDINKYI